MPEGGSFGAHCSSWLHSPPPTRFRTLLLLILAPLAHPALLATPLHCRLSTLVPWRGAAAGSVRRLPRPRSLRTRTHADVPLTSQGVVRRARRSLRACAEPTESTEPQPDLNLHTDVELVIESYFRRFEDFYSEAFALRKNIEVTQDTLELSLDEFRNRLIRINVHAAMATVGLAISTTVAGFFGMNLVSGLEEAPQMFWYVMGSAVVGGGLVYVGAVRAAVYGSAAAGKRFGDIDEIQVLNAGTPGKHDEYDMQDILLSYLESHGGADCRVTEEQFGELMETATGAPVNSEEIRRIFRVFDHDGSGDLDYGDCVKFICSQNNIK